MKLSIFCLIQFILRFAASARCNCVAVTYIDAVTSWWPPASIMRAIGVPGYAPPNPYNIVNLAFWLTSGPADAALIWANPTRFFGADWMKNITGGSTDTSTFQKKLRKMYNDNGVRIMVSAFGATEFPTTGGKDPTKTAQDLAAFIKTNNLDGVDIDWEDNDAMNEGIGEQWLITFSTVLRNTLGSSYLISHAPQAPYFMGTSKYKSGGYLKVDQAVGAAINWYNIQFYNQVSSSYDTYQTLFIASNGWATNSSVFQMMTGQNDLHHSVPANRIVIGKPVTTGDAENTGYVAPGDLKANFLQAKGKWKTGFMTWQYSSDVGRNFQFASVVASAF